MSMETTPPEGEKFDGVIRPFEETDMPTLKKISEYWLQDFGAIAHDEVEKDMKTLHESLEKGSPTNMFVATTPDGKVIGMMGVTLQPKPELLPFAKTDDPSELIVAYVHPDYRAGKGVGTALINASQKLAREKGKKEILLESGPRNKHTGYPFYDKQPGFKRVGKINDFYGKGLHTVVWQKTF